MFIRVPEAHSRSFAKAISWRVVGSLETFTKIAIYYFHEQLWAWIPWWRADRSELRAARPAAGSAARTAAS
jgi:uncharacterized membrane protein